MYVCMVVLYEHFLDIDYGDCQSLGELKTYDIAPLTVSVPGFLDF